MYITKGVRRTTAITRAEERRRTFQVRLPVTGKLDRAETRWPSEQVFQRELNLPHALIAIYG